MTLSLKDLFEQPIDRRIDGVIKADDEAGLGVELKEYVITNEIGQRLEAFLDAYNNYDHANGVWISGFFGSGKSHLLKMLALVLENRRVGDQWAYDIFAEKLKDQPMLAGALRKAASLPSKSILFNIDQKADVISKTEIDALLSVFQKVFDEACGFYGKQPHIAQFERDLASRGELQAFKQCFLNVSGKSWESGREEAILESRNIDAAFATATGREGTEAVDILGRYRTDTRISIEDFAQKVKDWIESQPKGFRLTFFVDEVGQYIAGDVKLMTNLQTIAESLNTRCRGQAWLIVTAQQDMAAVIGDRTAQQEHDFSKIQARFDTRMPLNSKDVAEVIQRRLLAKTPDGQTLFGNLYDREEKNLQTLFQFQDSSFNFTSFSGRDHFVASTPFPAYQYDLFQLAMSGLSEHNAFEGKHLSVGERSMLGVFQEVAKQLQDQQVGDLATFDLMFEGLRTALTSQVQQHIQLAEKHLSEERFAVRVLKALFLVKYVKEFKATVRNISILLLPRLEADQTELHNDVKQALALLESNTLIQRDGDVYGFLTNEEQDIEEEIKAFPIDHSELLKELETLAFDDILKQRKIRYQATGNDYAFSRKIDGQLLGREQELSIHMISPLRDDSEAPQTIRMRSMGCEEIFVLLNPDQQFSCNLALFKQTEKFMRQTRSGAPQLSREQILTQKGEQNARRRRDLEQRLRQLVSEAQFFVSGDEIDVAGEDAQERVVKAFQTLVDKVYVNLPMLRSVSYTGADLAEAASPKGALLGQDDGGGMGEAEREVLHYIQGRERSGVKVPVKSLVKQFGKKPYGWPDAATLCLAAHLSGRGKVEARLDATLLEGDDLAKALGKSQMLDSILLKPQVAYNPTQLRAAKDLYQDLFDKPAEGTDARSLGGEWAKAVQKLCDELDGFMKDKGDYPFLSALDPFASAIKAMRDKSPDYYMTEAVKKAEALLTAKEKRLDPIRGFLLPGPQRHIYDEARVFLRDEQGNLEYSDKTSVDKVREGLATPLCYEGATIQTLKSDLHALKQALELRRVEERKIARTEVQAVADKIAQLPTFPSLTGEQRAHITARIDDYTAKIDATKLIPQLRDLGHGAQSELLLTLVAEVYRLLHPAPKQVPNLQPGLSDRPAPTPQAPRPVRAAKIKVAAPKPLLTDEADVDPYLKELRKSLLAEIRAGRSVIV